MVAKAIWVWFTNNSVNVLLKFCKFFFLDEFLVKRAYLSSMKSETLNILFSLNRFLEGDVCGRKFIRLTAFSGKSRPHTKRKKIRNA